MVATTNDLSSVPSPRKDAPAGQDPTAVNDADPKAKLKSMGYDEQVAALKPADGPPPAAKPPAAAAQPAAAPQKTRSQILREQAGKLETLEDLMSYSFFDLKVTDAEATKALHILACMPDGQAPVVVQALNAKDADFMNRLAENAPDDAQAKYPLSFLTVLAMCNRVPEIEQRLDRHPSCSGVTPKHTGRAEIGWLITKASGGFVKRMGQGSSPPFSRWIELAPEPQKTSVTATFKEAEQTQKDNNAAKEARKAEDQRVTAKFDKTTTPEGQTAADALRGRIQSIEELLSYSFGDICITDADARKVLSLLNKEKDPDAIRYAVMRLDKGPFMDRFIENLAPNDRWNNKRTFLNILAARKPEKNVPYVIELMSYGVFDWAITDEEARLAFYLVKTMPKDVRDQFKDKDGGKWWARMEGNLDQDTKTAKDANFYDNKEEIQTKKLEFKAGAKGWPQGELRMAIEMLVRMGQEDFVEGEMQSLGFDKNPDYEWAYKEFGFAKAGGERDPKVWKAFKEKSAGQKFVEGLAQVGAGVKVVGSVIGQALVSGPIGAAATGKYQLGVNLHDVETMLGGDIYGVKLAKNDKEGNNQLGLSFDLEKMQMSIGASSLALASVAQVVDQTRIATGPINVDQIQLDAKWPTPDDPEAYYKLSIKGLGAKDIWLTSEQAMTGIGGVSLSNFSLLAKPQGTMPKDKSALMATALADVQQAMTRLIGMIDVKDPQPEQIGMKLGKDFTGAVGAKVSLGALTVQDVTQSAGGYIGKVEAKGLEVSMSSKSKGDAVRARLATFAEKEKKGDKLDDKSKADKAELEAALPAIVALEKRQAELVDKKKNDGELAPGDSEELQHTRDQLMVTTADISVASLAVKDLDAGGMKAKSLEVADLKAKVSGERNAGGEAGAMDMLPKPGKPKPDSKVNVELSVGSVKGTGLVIAGKSRLEAYEAKINEIKAKIDAKTAAPEDVTLYESLRDELRTQEVHKNIVRRDEIELMTPEAQRDPKIAADKVRVSKALEPWVGKAPNTSIDELSAVGKDGKPALEGKVDVASGRMSVDLADAEVKGVKSGDLKLDEGKVKGLSLSAGAGADLRDGGLANITKTLTDASAKVDKVELKGLELGGRPQSVVLQEEADKLALKARLNAKDMTEGDKKRLEALPALVGSARADETKLAELRKLDPKTLTPEQETEVKFLADRADPKVTRVASAEMNNVSLKLDTKSGQVEVGAGKEAKAGDPAAPALKVDGVEIGQKRPDGSISATTKVESAQIASIGAAGKVDGAGPGLDKLMDPKAMKDLQGQLDVKGIEIKNLEMRGKVYSSELQAELDALADKQVKDGAAMSPEDQKRMTELPALVQQAKVDEEKLILLRRQQEQDPVEFAKHKDLGWEMKALAARLDPGARKIAKIEVGHVAAKVDTKVGKVEVGVRGKGGDDAAVKIEGIEMGKVGKDGQMVTDTKVASAKLDSLDATADTSSGAGALLDPMRSDKLRADIKGKGFEVKGVEKGKAGEAGSMKLDKLSLDQVGASYDKADGGKASLELQGAKLENFEMNSSKLADLEMRLGELLAKGRGGQELTPEEKAELEQRKTEYAEYNTLKEKFATAINKQWRKYYGDKLEAWEKVKMTGAKKAEVGKLAVSAQGIGQPGAFDVKGAKVQADLDKLNATGISAGDTKLDKLGIGSAHLEGQNMLDEEKRNIKVGVKALEAEGLKSPGTMVGKAKIQETNVDLKGRDLDIRARMASVSGAYSGGAGVGGANAGGVAVAIRGMGTEHETTSTAIAGFNAQGISKGKANGGSTNLKKAWGNNLILQSGKGGGPAGDIKGDGIGFEGLDDETRDKDGKVTKTHLDGGSVDTVRVRNNKDGSTSVSGTGAKIAGVDFSTDQKQKDGTRDTMGARLDKGTADGFDVNLSATGVDLKADGVTASGAGVTQTKYNKDGRKASEMKAGVSDFEATGDKPGTGGVHLQTTDDGHGATGLSAHADNAKVKGGYYQDSKFGNQNVCVPGTTPDKLASQTNAKIKELDAKDVNFGMTTNAAGDTRMKAGVGEAKVTDAKYDSTTYAKDGTTAIASTEAKADEATFKGVTADVSQTKKGDMRFDVGAKEIEGKGLGYTEKVDGNVVRSLEGINDKSLEGRKHAELSHAANGDASVKLTDLAVSGDKQVDDKGKVISNTIDASFGRIEGKNLVYTDVTNPESKVKAVLSYFETGDPSQPSKVSFDLKSGKIDADIKSIKLGPKSQIDFGKDPNSLLRFTDEVSIGSVKMEDFDPSDITSKGSKLEVANVKGENILYNSTDRRVYLTGGAIKKLSLVGTGQDENGEGHAVASYEGLEAKKIKSFARDKTDKDSKTLTKDVEVDDLESESGRVVLAKNGDDMSVVFANVQGAKAKSLTLDLDLREDPNLSEAQQLENAEKKKAAKQAKIDNYDPVKDKMDLSVLDKTSGKVKVKIPIGVITNGKHRTMGEADGLVDEVGTALQQETIDVEVDIVNGGIVLGDVNAALAAMGQGPLPGDPKIVWKARDFIEGKLNKAPTNDPANAWMNDIQFDVQAKTEGGHLQIGRDFEGDIKGGTTVNKASTEGTGLGKRIVVEGSDVGAEKVKLMDGDVRIGDVGAKTLKVEVNDLEGKNPGIKADVKDAEVKNVEYGDADKGQAAIADAQKQGGVGEVKHKKTMAEEDKEAADAKKLQDERAAEAEKKKAAGAK